MGIQERWQGRQEGIAAENEARDARWEAQMEALDTAVVQRAAAAFGRGDGWFEVEVGVRSAGSMSPYGAGSDLGVPAPGRARREDPRAPRAPRSDLLSRIEDEGWSLHTAQYVYVQLGAESREKWFASGEQVAVKGKIVGMYLFRRV
ncbi:hypothetical protein ACFXAO_23140 [Streptomyces lavendulae]|uniref:hypothetical protein n=1 Tax=Streptomyces lavendulae TaxID=1914 RepID=UPI00369FE88D